MFTETLTLKRIKQKPKKQEYYGTILPGNGALTQPYQQHLEFFPDGSGEKTISSQPAPINDLVAGVLKDVCVSSGA